MAKTRFIDDRGLTARMTLVLFLLGALFVALVVGLMVAFRGCPIALLIGVAGLGVAWYQWYRSDTVAMKAMRAREVTPEEAPELHAMIDRLVRAGRHAQAARRRRRHGPPQRLRHRPLARAAPWSA